jgi:steroid delta-isomerase-like uncharacterized protein
MKDKEGKVLFQRFIDESFNRGNIGVIDDIFATDFEEHLPSSPEPLRGPEGVRRLVSAYRTAFPDIIVTIDQLVAEGEWVAARVTASGTNTGDYMGFGSTGRSATWHVAHVCRVRAGRLVEDHIYFDRLSLLTQLGLASPPQPPP